MNLSERNDLRDRLLKAIETLGLQKQVSSVFFDEVDYIMTVELFLGVDKIAFCNAIEDLKILKKDDQVTITWK